MGRRVVVLAVIMVLSAAALLWWSQRSCEAVPCAPALALRAATATSTPVPSTATATFVPTSTPTATPSPTVTVTPQVVPYGAILTEDGAYATPTPRPRWVSEPQLVELYGDAAYADLESMPGDLSYYMRRTLDEVAEYFEVPQRALLALIYARNEDQIRLVQRAADGTLNGTANLSPRVWNGWAAPMHDDHLHSLRAIEQFGGLGFDWSARYSWQNWRTSTVMSYYQYSFASDANPTSFEDNVAALARYLLQEGLTLELATQNPEQFERALGAAIATFPQTATGIRPLAAPLADPPADETLMPIRAAFQQEMARRFGVRLSEADQLALVDAKLTGEQSQQGADQLATQLVSSFVEQQTQAAQLALAEGRPLPWPFLLTPDHLAIQEQAVALIGHTLAPWEIEQLLRKSEADALPPEDAMADLLEVELYSQSYALLDEGLRRTARGLPLYNYEVTALLQPALSDSMLRSRGWMSSRQQALVLGTVEQRLRRSAEYRELNGDLFFSAFPLDPMPQWVLQPYGVPASYQPEGIHTGLDLRGERSFVQQPTIYAVEAGTVTHVGPLYCLREGACRGAFAVVIHHGNNIYTTYSHNSAALVEAGQRVEAGQAIALQGSEGYSRGPHLHLEVHVGAPWSGDWTVPWTGGRFVDPWPWLPEMTDRE